VKRASEWYRAREWKSGRAGEWERARERCSLTLLNVNRQSIQPNWWCKGEGEREGDKQASKHTHTHIMHKLTLCCLKRLSVTSHCCLDIYKCALLLKARSFHSSPWPWAVVFNSYSCFCCSSRCSAVSHWPQSTNPMCTGICEYIYNTLLYILAVHGMPSPLNWGPSSNRGPGGGPAWNGGDTTDNIILHANGNGHGNGNGNGKWRY